MKRALIITVATLAIFIMGVSCSRMEETYDPAQGEEMALIALIEDTRTSNDGLNTNWSIADKASLFHCGSGESTYRASCFTYGTDGIFKGIVTGKSATNDWFFAYPYSSANISPEDIRVYVNPSPEQDGNSSTTHLCGEDFPIFGTCSNVPSSDTVSMSMSNSLAVIKLVVKNTLEEAITVRKIQFTSSTVISGDFSVDITSGTPDWISRQGSGNSVILTVNDGTPITADGSADFYFGFVPHSSTQETFTVTAVTAGGKTVKYQVCRENKAGDLFKAGKFKVMRLNFDDTHPASVNYVKVTESQTDWTGTYLFVSESDKKAFAAFSGVSGYAVAVDIKNGTIASNETIDKYALTVTPTGKQHPAISNAPAYDVCNSDGKFIYWSSNKGGIVLDDNNIYEQHPSNNNQDTQYGHVFEYSDNAVKVKSAGFKSGFTNYYLRYSSGAFSYNKASNTVQLYKLCGEVRQGQTLSFPSASLTWKVGDKYEIESSYEVQRVEGAKTAVTYTSDKPDVASVSGNLITIRDYGTAIITASATASDDYYEASASYTLTIGKDGVYNLENSSVKAYLDEAYKQYTDDNYKTLTIVTNYNGGQSATNRKDTPAPVSLSWESTSTAVRSVKVYNDASMTDLETSVTTTANSADVVNLIPGRTYWYSVTTDPDGVIASGQFNTEGRRRMLLVSNTRAKGHANNCRDIGGLMTTDGKKLKYGIIFRGSNMDMTTDAEKSIIVDYMNVGIDIDLRSDTASYTSEGEDGCATDYNPWTGSWTSKIEYCNDGACSGSFSSDFKVGLTDKNKKFTAMFTKLVNTIKTGKAAYIHCHVGADRTGYVCLIIESVLGVSPKDCSIDFELTSFSVVGNRLRTGDSSHNMCKDALNYINSYTKGTTYQEKAYNILLDYGITKEQIDGLKSIMLED